MGTLSLDEPILEHRRHVSTALGLALHEGAGAGMSGLGESQLPSFHVFSSVGAAGPFTGLSEATCPLSVQTEPSKSRTQFFQVSVLC